MNSTLRDKAIQFALNNEWEEAVETNRKILKNNPTDRNAKLRLGKALIQLNSFEEAKKYLLEVLDDDPLNAIAKKNLKAIKEVSKAAA